MTPEDATHRDSGGNLYKAGDELNWLRWGNDEWFIYGTVPAGTLTRLNQPEPVVAAPAAPMAPTLTENYAPPAPRLSTACEDTFCIRERLIGSKFCLIHGAAPAPPVQVSISSEVGRMPQYAPMKPSTADNWGTCGQAPAMPQPGVPFIHYFTKYKFVGSRVTCNPPPLDTDQDVLVLVRIGHLAVMELKILEDGFVKEGSLPAEADTQAGKDNVFHSYRKGDMNYIVTTDEAFYQRFSTATELARKYNLMEKSDRIQLFQAVLYGKWWV